MFCQIRPDDPTLPCRPPSTSDLLTGLRFAATSPALWRLSAVYALKSVAAYALIFWTPLAISDLLGAASGPNAAVLLTAVPYTFAAATAVAVGWSSHARDERRLHTAVPFAVGAAILLCSPLLQVPVLLRECKRGSHDVRNPLKQSTSPPFEAAWAVQGPAAAIPAFAALCVALSACNATGPVTASMMRCLPPEAQAGGLALWNSLANVGGYFGPAVYGWLKDATGSNAPGMVVRLPSLPPIVTPAPPA